LWETCLPVISEVKTGNGADYRGAQTKTKSGLDCQKWGAQAPHMHKITEARYPDSGLFDAGFENACRNPDGESDIWCYTMSPTKLWETCVPIVHPVIVVPTVSEEYTGNGADYRGAQNKTRWGEDCVKWEDNIYFRFTDYPDSGLNGNFCRNPKRGDPWIWCYTSIDTKEFDWCEPLAQ